MKYGCHADGEIEYNCVLDEGDVNGCVYAKEGMKREECPLWKPIRETKEPAAGPWCYDLESAPEDHFLLCLYPYGWDKRKKYRGNWYGENNIVYNEPPAYARINMPEGI